MDRKSLVKALQGYVTNYQDEKIFLPNFLSLLNHPDCYQRTHLPAHLTGSALVVNKDRSHVLLTHHAKLNRWLQPGGHADGEEDIFNVARREAQEETGLKTITPVNYTLFDIDIHPIPARADFPAHDHYDIRFLFYADRYEPITVSEESYDVKWIPMDELSQYNTSLSLLRLLTKVLT